MNRGWGGIIVFGILLFASAYTLKNILQVKPRLALSHATTADQVQESKLPEVNQAAQMVTMVGPLANYVQQNGSLPHPAGTAIPSKLVGEDHVEDSPVGTANLIVRKTFVLANTLAFPFEVPAHAATPQLSGTYRSFARQPGPQWDQVSQDIEVAPDERATICRICSGTSCRCLIHQRSFT